jgi:hypothetical protein
MAAALEILAHFKAKIRVILYQKNSHDHPDAPGNDMSRTSREHPVRTSWRVKSRTARSRRLRNI